MFTRNLNKYFSSVFPFLNGSAGTDTLSDVEREAPLLSQNDEEVEKERSEIESDVSGYRMLKQAIMPLYARGFSFTYTTVDK